MYHNDLGCLFSRYKHFNRGKDDPKKNTVYDYLGSVFRLREEKCQGPARGASEDGNVVN